MNPETDSWATFTVNFAARGPAHGECVTPLIQAIAREAALWAHARKLKLDDDAAAYVAQIIAPHCRKKKGKSCPNAKKHKKRSRMG